MQKNAASFRGEGRHALSYTGIKYGFVSSAVIDVTAGDFLEIRLSTNISETVAAGDGVWACIEEVPAYDRALVYKTSSQAHTLGTLNAVAFGGEVYDTNSIHDPTTNNSRLTVPAGKTEARFSFGLNYAAGGDLQGRVFKNGDTATVVPGLPSREGNNVFINRISALGAWVPATPGDFFELYFDTINGTLADADATWFCGEFR